MLQFTKLRLSGFKSFVEKTELEIGPGLNGIVGPNGCGKSNLVEALRWVMGESSAKRMRGDGMEDVIFAGTDRRSARNLAEVSLLLDNSSRQAPAAYNGLDEIEVTRRIERDRGSDYRINGKMARARDVQMLFADTVTGANSPSLVSQGHVTRMINAKPQDRRLILEESAGIAGLYARRHEAELRLKAADTNLLRVVDVLGSMETRLASLKRQSKQATRYRNLNAQIRQFELIVTYLEWQALVERQRVFKQKFSGAESIVAERLSVVTQLTKTQNTQAEEIPPLRHKEAEISAALQTRRLALQRLEDENKRQAQTLQETKDQVHQTNIDKQNQEQTLEECTVLLERIQAEQETLAAEQSAENKDIQEKQEKRDALKLHVLTLEEKYTSLKENAAESRARIESLERQIRNSESRMSILQSRKSAAQNERSALSMSEESLNQITVLEQKIKDLESMRDCLNLQVDESRSLISDSEGKTEQARQSVAEAQSRMARFNAEISTLERFFQNDKGRRYKAILDKITTESGFEKALSRALGDSLMASTDAHASEVWVTRENDCSTFELPDGVSSLLPHVNAPKELHLALSQIGFVTDEDQGNALATCLKAGQSLVSAQGTYWRWDGYIVRAQATDRHAVYLEQKNKLAELERARGSITSVLESEQKTLESAIDEQKAARQHYEALLSDIRGIEQKLADSRPALTKLKEKMARMESESSRLDTILKTAEDDIANLHEGLDFDQKTLNAIHAAANSSEDISIELVKSHLDESKELYQAAMRDFDLFQQAQRTRRARMQAISDERISLQNRSIRAREHLKTLTARAENLSEKLVLLKTQPKSFEKDYEGLLDQITAFEVERNQAADRLAACEKDLTVTLKALKESEKILGDAREQRAHAQATLSALNEQLLDMERQITETLSIPPKDLVNHAAMDMVQYQSTDLDRLKAERETLVRERDSIGPVNLMAETEAEELEKELSTLLHERNDLLQAIEELRGGIAKINKEARERLMVAFDHVNAHFQHLFMRLFSGGKAHLKLIDSDDPLGAGLEIFAQPPGKALQSLSLMSGGEQTLASIALIFAMFMTNPSPICVLDEIDAPLDDANVDRVCDLLEEIAERGTTRFLVITHHRLSMARMDRLYGVTMSEKGVSQLVSVDLQQSFEFIDKKVA